MTGCDGDVVVGGTVDLDRQRFTRAKCGAAGDDRLQRVGGLTDDRRHGRRRTVNYQFPTGYVVSCIAGKIVRCRNDIICSIHD